LPSVSSNNALSAGRAITVAINFYSFPITNEANLLRQLMLNF
jgi:hypothetical protein